MLSFCWFLIVKIWVGKHQVAWHFALFRYAILYCRGSRVGMGIRWTMELFMDSKNKTRRSLLCAAERDGTGTWLIPSPVLMAASVIHIPMLCSSPGKATERGKYCQEGMRMNSSSRPSRKASCGELDPLGLKTLSWVCIYEQMSLINNAFNTTSTKFHFCTTTNSCSHFWLVAPYW